MTASIMPTPKPQFDSAAGVPLVGGQLFTYAAGTSTPKATYSDAAGTVPQTNPIVLNSRGEPTNPIYWSGSYYVELYDSVGTLIYTVDNFQANVNSAELLQAAGAGMVGFSVGSTYPANTVGRWLVDLALGAGSSFIGFLASGVGAVARSLQERLTEEVRVMDYMTAAQKSDVLARTALVDTSPAWTLAINRLIAIRGKRIIAPGGIYRLNGGTASGDGYKNGILLPDTNGDFTTGNGITIVGDGVETVFKAGSTNMIVLRHSRLYSGGENFKIDGAGLANVWGRGIVPEDMTQTTEQVSQSYATYKNVTIENCIEGSVFMPGPRVGGADSGCFYHNLYGCIYNNNLRDVWMKKDITLANNRTTRTSFYGPTFTRGNTGVQIDGGTEIDFYSPNFELINTGTSPSAVPTAFSYTDSNPANIRIFGGYAEACTKAIYAVNPNQVMLFGFNHNSTKDASEFLMGRFQTGRLTVPKLFNTAAYMNLGGEGFVGFVADPDQDGSRTMALQINSADKKRWSAAGDETFFGTSGNVLLYRDGLSLRFSSTGTNSISSAGSLIVNGDNMFLRSAAGASGVRLDTIGTKSLFPEVDNAVLLGQTGFRWSAVWAANGTIQTSDERTKKDIIDTPLGLDFINALRPVAYRFKVGGNIITGQREITPAVLNEDGEEIESAVTEPIIEQVPGKRQHFGFLTKNVKAAAGDVDFGGFIKTDIDDPDSEEALRYDEFIPPLVRAVQELNARMAALEASK